MTNHPEQRTLWEFEQSFEESEDACATAVGCHSNASSEKDEKLATPHGHRKKVSTHTFSSAKRRQPESEALRPVSRAQRAHRLTQLLESHLGRVRLIVHDNRRRMVMARDKRHYIEFRLHHMFLDADELMVEALAQFARGDREARGAIREFIASHRDKIRRDIGRGKLRTQGKHHNLDEILDQILGCLESEFLDDIEITWGKHGRGQRSIRMGSFDFDQRLIRIHPALDQEWVPTYFVQFVVYHEVLHAFFPPKSPQGSSRRRLHPPEFRALERKFPLYEQAITWEKKNLKRLLKSKA